MEGIDHLVYTAGDLEKGKDEIEALLGVRPEYGGSHPDFGTHNALLSLGPTTYLEVIAQDPDLTIPKNGLPFGLDPGRKSCLSTWAYRSERIVDHAAAAGQAGVDVGAIETGNRQKADGKMLSWKLTNPRAMLLGGAVPFLIDWGKTAHPAGNAPYAGELVGFHIEHPQPDKVRTALAAIAVEVNLVTATTMRIVAKIQTDHGIMEL